MQQFTDIGRLLRHAGDPQTDGDGQFVALEPERMADTANQAIEHGADVLFPLAVVKIDDEFVPSEPRHHVILPDAALQPAAQLLQQLIAGTVAQGVIDLLEVIHIDENQGEAGCLVTAVAGHGMMQVIHQQRPVWQLGQRVVQGIELEPPLQLLMMLEPFLQPQVGLAQLLESLVDGLLRVELIELLSHPFELQQQGQLMAQEIEEQPVIGFQRPGHVEDEVGKVLLLLAQGQAVPVKSLFMALYAVGAVAHGPNDVIVVCQVWWIESLQSLVFQPDQQHVADREHLAQHSFQLGKQGMLRQVVSQAHHSADLLDFLLPLGIPLHERGSLPRQLGTGLGFVQAFGQALQQQPQGGCLIRGAACQQPLHVDMLHRLHAPALTFIEPGELFGEARFFPSQLLLEHVGKLIGVAPVQPPVGQPQHGEMLQRAECVQHTDQSGVILGGGNAGGGKIHDGGDDRQQGVRVWRCGGLN